MSSTATQVPDGTTPPVHTDDPATMSGGGTDKPVSLEQTRDINGPDEAVRELCKWLVETVASRERSNPQYAAVSDLVGGVIRGICSHAEDDSRHDIHAPTRVDLTTAKRFMDDDKKLSSFTSDSPFGSCDNLLSTEDSLEDLAQAGCDILCPSLPVSSPREEINHKEKPAAPSTVISQKPTSAKLLNTKSLAQNKLKTTSADASLSLKSPSATDPQLGPRRRYEATPTREGAPRATQSAEARPTRRSCLKLRERGEESPNDGPGSGPRPNNTSRSRVNFASFDQIRVFRTSDKLSVSESYVGRSQVRSKEGGELSPEERIRRRRHIMFYLKTAAEERQEILVRQLRPSLSLQPRDPKLLALFDKPDLFEYGWDRHPNPPRQLDTPVTPTPVSKIVAPLASPERDDDLDLPVASHTSDHDGLIGWGSPNLPDFPPAPSYNSPEDMRTAAILPINEGTVGYQSPVDSPLRPAILEESSSDSLLRIAILQERSPAILQETEGRDPQGGQPGVLRRLFRSVKRRVRKIRRVTAACCSRQVDH